MQNLNKFSITLDSQVNILLDTCKKVLDGGVFKGRIIKHKLQKHIKSKDPLEKLYAILMIISDGRYSNGIPSGESVYEALDQVNVYMAEEVARKYVQNQVEVEVETVKECEEVKETVKEETTDFEVISRIIEVKGKYGQYRIHDNIITIDDAIVGFKEEEDIKQWYKAEREELEKKIALLNAKEEEAIQALNKFM